MKILGYVWGYKESGKVSDNTISITFKSGVSKSYPHKYKDKKDFGCEVVKEGDVSKLYLEAEEALAIFNHEYVDSEDDVYKENWEEKYSEMMSWPEWKWCWSIAGVEMSAGLGHYMIEDAVYEKLGLNEKTKKLYEKYQKKAEYEYDESIKEALA
jgi:hypothetical protein